MDNENYISPNKITKQYDITSGTLRRWSEAGKIRCLRPNGGKRIYNIDDINKIFSNNKDNKDKEENKDEKDEDNEKVKQSIKILKENINRRQNKDDYNSFIEFVETELDDVKSLLENLKIKKYYI
jgi:DNA-binding transcriptional MerR regulator